MKFKMGTKVTSSSVTDSGVTLTLEPAAGGEASIHTFLKKTTKFLHASHSAGSSRRARSTRSTLHARASPKAQKCR